MRGFWSEILIGISHLKQHCTQYGNAGVIEQPRKRGAPTRLVWVDKEQVPSRQAQLGRNPERLDSCCPGLVRFEAAYLENVRPWRALS